MMASKVEGTTVVDLLIEIGRTRALTESESRRLSYALRKTEKAGQRWWTRFDDRRLKEMLAQGKKPRHICHVLGRTERAVWRRIYKKGWTVKGLAQGSIAIRRGM